MPYPTTNTNPSEIKLFYQVYDGKSSKPHDAFLFNSDFSHKFEEDVVDDLVDKGLWDETLEQQLENKQLYFKVFREDEDMIPADAVMFENVRLLPNQGLLSLEESLQNTVNWFGSFIPERVKQTAFSLGNSLAQWTEDKLTGFSAYSGIPTIEKMDEKSWREIVEGRHCEERSGVAIQNLEHPGLLRSTRNDAREERHHSEELPSKAFGNKLRDGFDKTIKKDVESASLDPTYEKMKRDEKNETDSTSRSLAESLLNTAWGFASYAYNNPLKTFTLALAACVATNSIRLPKNKFEIEQQFSNGISTATNMAAKLAIAHIATHGRIQTSTPLNTIITGMSLWNPVGATTPEFQVNTYTTNDQSYPSVASFADGSFVVTWRSYGQDGSSGYGVYGQRFNATGSKLGSEFRVNTYTATNQEEPSVASFVDGGFVVAWRTDSDGSLWGVYGQRFNATGGKLGPEFLVNTYTGNYQQDPVVRSFLNGGFVVSWYSYLQDGSNHGIFAQYFNSTGAKGGLVDILVNTYTAGNQFYQSTTSFGNGGFVVTWYGDGEYGTPYDVWGQIFNATGAKVGSAILVNTYTTSSQEDQSVSSFIDNSFVVTWESSGQDGAGYGIYGQRFNASGAKIGLEFQVNTYTTGDQQSSSVATFIDNSFVVTWDNYGQDAASTYGIYGQRFNASGTKIGSEFRVNAYTTSDQRYPSVASFSDGSFVVTWHSNGQDGASNGIYGRIFTPPSLGNNTLIINEGQTKFLTSTMLSASAPQTDPATLIFTVNNVTQGRFELLSNPGLPIFNFTQQYVMNGQIRFIHDGSKIKPAYYVKVSDTIFDTIPAPATIIFDAYPVLGSNQLTIAEGQSILISSTNLNATDVDNPVDSLIFNISALSHGQFEFVSNPGIAISNFSQQAIFNSMIRFVHDGVEVAPAYNITVSDGLLNTPPSVASIIFTNVNDAPILIGTGESFTFTEKSVAQIIDSNITLSDVDNMMLTNATIAITNNFRISEDILGFVDQAGITGIYNSATGQLSLTGFSLISNYQAALRNITYFNPSFNPSVSPRTVSFTVNDGTVNSNTITRLINIDPISDAPTLSGSGGTLSFTEKNSPKTIDQNIIVFDDSTNLRNATVRFISSVLPEDVLSFTAQGGISGAYSNATGILVLTGSSSVSNYQSALRSVTYFNPSLNPSAALRIVSFSVNDGEFDSNTVNCSISITPVNDAPILSTNTLTVLTGQSFNLTSTQLHANDPDTPNSGLTFTISAIQFCRFERVTAPGVPITTFTQQEINNSQIRFVHTGSGVSAPAYQVSVSDGQYSTTPASASINFNGSGFAPSLTANKLTISQGGVVILSTNQLNAFDIDTGPTGLTFTASNIRYGSFSIVGNPTNTITTFTLQSINNGFVQFIHDGSENAPSYDISVSDGILATNTQAAIITYLNINQAPIVINVIPDRLSEKVDLAFSFSVAANTFFDSDPGDQNVLVYSAKMQNGNVLPVWISFNSVNRQFTGKPLTAGKTSISVFAADPSNAIGVANFTIDVSATSAVQTPITSTQNETLRNSLIAAGVSGFVGLGFFALKYGIKRAVNKKLQTALEAGQTDTEKKLQEYDKEVIIPIATHINNNLKVTAPFESISTEKVKNFVSAVRVLVSMMAGLKIQYRTLDAEKQNIVHATIIRELKRITTPTNEDCCSALLRCGFFKAEVTPQQIVENAEVIAKAVESALTKSIPLIPIPAPPKPDAPRNSTILPKLEAERAARQQLEIEMAEMKNQMTEMSAMLRAQSVAPASIQSTTPATNVAVDVQEQRVLPSVRV
jgi:hypothetical protein